jgi:voltage-gated potassium channel
MLVLCLFALTLLGAETLLPLDPEVAAILQYADFALCLLFLCDFVGNVIRAENKWRYLVTWGWIDLLSSIPAIDALRLGRAARLLRILRLLRAVRSARVLAQFAMAHRSQSAGLAVSLLALMLVVFSSIAILQFEMAVGGNIKTAEDAMWWSLTTMTTVGYGDRFPITSAGRVVAVLVMIAGVGLVGTLSGIMAGWFLAGDVRAADRDREELKQLLMQVREQLTLPPDGVR